MVDAILHFQYCTYKYTDDFDFDKILKDFFSTYNKKYVDVDESRNDVFKDDCIIDDIIENHQLTVTKESETIKKTAIELGFVNENNALNIVKAYWLMTSNYLNGDWFDYDTVGPGVCIKHVEKIVKFLNNFPKHKLFMEKLKNNMEHFIEMLKMLYNPV